MKSITKILSSVRNVHVPHTPGSRRYTLDIYDNVHVFDKTFAPWSIYNIKMLVEILSAPTPIRVIYLTGECTDSDKRLVPSYCNTTDYIDDIFTLNVYINLKQFNRQTGILL